MTMNIRAFAFRAREQDVGYGAVAEQHEQGRADEFRDEW